MPVRSLHSSVIKWPARADVLDAFRIWAGLQREQRNDIVRIGCFGSIVNGTWGVGSDIDIIVVVSTASGIPIGRAAQWDTTDLPVPADVVVLTEKEACNPTSRRFQKVLEEEVVWVERFEHPAGALE